ncbi:MAG: hypothetical protein ACR2PV_03995 [Gammaproteobacteria bacterium]
MISKNAIQQFSQDGYCLAEGLLSPADFAPVIAHCEHTLKLESLAGGRCRLCLRLSNNQFALSLGKPQWLTIIAHA